MKDLLKWQFVSFLSRGLAMAIGIVQSIVIVRILSVSEYGVVTLATSIGGAFGIYQHLGLASGSTREISAAKDNAEIFKIFVTSVLIRYLISLPLAFFLFFLADNIALNQYGDSSLILPLRIFSIILLIQAVQSMFNSVIAGMQKFKSLFIYQVVIAAVGLLIYIPLIYLYKVNGYFYSLAIFNVLASITLGLIALAPLRGNFVLPTISDLKRLGKEILSISLAIYLVKIIFTYWQKSGPLLLGLKFSAEEVGLFGFALLYASKLLMVSDSITDVSLPVLSKKFQEDLHDFKILFTSNFSKVFSFIIFASATAIFWVRDIFHLLLGSNKYDGSLPFIFPLVIAFVFYSIINIVKSSILIPARIVWGMITSFIFMLISTVAFYVSTNESMGGLLSMSYAMLLGAVVGVVLTAFFIYQKLKFIYIKFDVFLLFMLALLVCIPIYTDSFIYRLSVFVVFAFIYLVILFQSKILKKEHMNFILSKIGISK